MSLRDDFRASDTLSRAFVLIGLFWGAFGAYAPWIKAQAGLDDGQFGLGLLCGAAGSVAAMWIAPRVDRALGARAVSVSAALVALAFVLPGLANGWLLFAIAMVLAMGTSGLLDVIINSRLSGLEAHSGRSLMNLNHALFSFAYAGSALVAGLLREADVPPLYCFLGIGCVALLTGLRNVPMEPPEDGTQETNLTLPKALLVCAGLVTLVGFMAEQATEGWSALHLERSLGVGAAEGAMGPAILGLTMGIGRLGGQFLTRIMSEARALQGAGALAALGAISAAWAPNVALAYLGFALLGFGVSIIAPMTLAWVGKAVSTRQRPEAISKVVLVGYTGFFLGPPLMGFLAAAFGLPVAFTVMGGLLAAIAMVLVPALRAMTQGRQAHLA